MVSIRSINPMVRAVGTMGAVAAVVGGITFASLTSNTVALSNNQLATATAQLAIGAGTSCPEEEGTSTPGFNAKLVPGVESAPVNFCLDNTGDVPLDITAQIPEDIGASSLDWNKVTLKMTCTGTDNTITATVAAFHAAAKSFPGNPLNNSAQWNCSVTATADADVSGGTLAPFTINFVGTQVAPAT